MNDAWVMSAWGKANEIKKDEIVSVIPYSMFSGLQWTNEATVVHVRLRDQIFEKHRLDERTREDGEIRHDH